MTPKNPTVWHTFKQCRTTEPVPAITVDGKLQHLTPLIWSIIENLEQINRDQEKVIEFMARELGYCTCNHCQEKVFRLPNKADGYLHWCPEGAVLHEVEECCLTCAMELFSNPDEFASPNDYQLFVEDIAYWVSVHPVIQKRPPWWNFTTDDWATPRIADAYRRVS